MTYFVKVSGKSLELKKIILLQPLCQHDIVGAVEAVN